MTTFNTPTDQFRYDDLAERMSDDLPEWFAKGKGSNNYKILRGPGDSLEDVDAHIENIEEAVHVQTATTMAELSYLADEVGISPRENESLEHFRARIIAEYQVTSAKGDINGLLKGASNFLQVDLDTIEYYEDPDKGGKAELHLPQTAFTQIDLTDVEVADYAEKMIAPSYSLTVFSSGTLEYVSEETYYACESGYGSSYGNDWGGAGYGSDSWDNYEGYADLDTNGNPTDGGTYSGVIEN